MTLEEKKKNFKKVSPKMLEDARKKIRRISNLANNSFYSYEWKDVAYIIETLEEELKTTREILKGTKKGHFDL